MCSVFSPIFIARATTDLTNGDYHHASINAGTYCLLVFLSKALKECQNLVYLVRRLTCSINLHMRAWCGSPSDSHSLHIHACMHRVARREGLPSSSLACQAWQYTAHINHVQN